MKTKSQKRWSLVANIVLSVSSFLALMPFLLLIIASFTDEEVAMTDGYTYFPAKWSLAAYDYIVGQAAMIGRAYGMTIITTLIGTSAGIVITALFDVDEKLIGQSVRGIPILSLCDLTDYVKNNQVDIAAFTMPRSKAPMIASGLVELGVRAFWNFAHVDLELFDKDVVVENVHLSDSLMHLSYNTVKHTKEKEG